MDYNTVNYSFDIGTVAMTDDTPRHLHDIVLRGEACKVEAAVEDLPKYRSYKPPPEQKNAYDRLIAALEKSGILRTPDPGEETKLLNNHFTRVKTDGVTLRLIFSGTRINTLIGDPPRIAMTALKNMRKNVRDYEYSAQDDFKHHFYAFRVKRSFQPYLAIRCGGRDLFFTRLPMGYNRSSFITHTHTRTLVTDHSTYHGDDTQHWGNTQEETAQVQKQFQVKAAANGILVNYKKSRPPSRRGTSLGIDKAHDLNATRPSKGTAEATSSYVAAYIAAGRDQGITLWETQVLFGKIEWCVYADPHYRYLAAPLLPLLTAVDDFTRLTDTDVDTLTRIHERLQQRPWANIPVAHTDDTQTVWTDASFTAMAVVAKDNTWGKISSPEETINSLEAEAILFALNKFEGALTILTDSMVCIQASKKGWSKTPILNELANALRQRRQKFHTVLRHVRSEHNKADQPSRATNWTTHWTSRDNLTDYISA